jgi:hypothetical protein
VRAAALHSRSLELALQCAMRKKSIGEMKKFWMEEKKTGQLPSEYFKILSVTWFTFNIIKKIIPHTLSILINYHHHHHLLTGPTLRRSTHLFLPIFLEK